MPPTTARIVPSLCSIVTACRPSSCPPARDLVPLPGLVHFLYILPYEPLRIHLVVLLLVRFHSVFPHSVSPHCLAHLRCVASHVCGHVIVPFILSTPFLTITVCPSPLSRLTILPQLATFP